MLPTSALYCHTQPLQPCRVSIWPTAPTGRATLARWTPGSASCPVYAAALRMAQTVGWKLDSNDSVAGFMRLCPPVHGLTLTLNVVIRILADGTTSRLDTRSESREGDRHAGKNAQLIRTYRAAFCKQLELQTSMKF